MVAAIVDSFTNHTWVTLQIHSEVTLNHIPHYSRHYLFFHSIPPSMPVPILLLTFGPQPERVFLPRHISAQHHSHGLCLAWTHPSSSLNLLWQAESWPVPEPSSPSCWINMNIHHSALCLSEPHNEQLTKQCFIYVSHWKEWTSGTSLISVSSLFCHDWVWKLLSIGFFFFFSSFPQQWYILTIKLYTSNS